MSVTSVLLCHTYIEQKIRIMNITALKILVFNLIVMPPKNGCFRSKLTTYPQKKSHHYERNNSLCMNYMTDNLIEVLLHKINLFYTQSSKTVVTFQNYNLMKVVKRNLKLEKVLALIH